MTLINAKGVFVNGKNIPWDQIDKIKMLYSKDILLGISVMHTGGVERALINDFPALALSILEECVPGKLEKKEIEIFPMLACGFVFLAFLILGAMFQDYRLLFFAGANFTIVFFNPAKELINPRRVNALIMMGILLVLLNVINL